MAKESRKRMAFPCACPFSVTTGALPWSTSEGWYDVVRKCGPSALLARLDDSKGNCASLLAARKATLDAALDHYDHVLMIAPPDYARALEAPRLELEDRRGSVWMFRVVTAAPAAAK